MNTRWFLRTGFLAVLLLLAGAPFWWADAQKSGESEAVKKAREALKKAEEAAAKAKAVCDKAKTAWEQASKKAKQARQVLEDAIAEAKKKKLAGKLLDLATEPARKVLDAAEQTAAKLKTAFDKAQKHCEEMEQDVREARERLDRLLQPFPLPMSGTAVKQLAAFDDVMQKFMKDRNIHAGTLAVMKNGKVVLARGYGWADRTRGKLLGPDAPFRIASISKPITAAAIWMLIQEGKISLKTAAFLFLAVNPPAGQKVDERLKLITVEHLLEHRGGWDRNKLPPINPKLKELLYKFSGDADGTKLPLNELSLYDPMFQTALISASLKKTGPADANDIIRFMAGQKLDFDPGERKAYSNFGYCVLGRVIEKASGKKYIDYVRQQVLAPLKLKSIELARTLPGDRNPREPYYDDPVLAPNVVRPLELPKKGKLPGTGPLVPLPDGAFYVEAMDAHGGLIASAPDLVHFANAHFIENNNDLGQKLGQPRGGAGVSNGAQFTGAMPGTYAVVMQFDGGVNVAVLFNQWRIPEKLKMGLEYSAINGAIGKTVSSIKTWPKGK